MKSSFIGDIEDDAPPPPEQPAVVETKAEIDNLGADYLKPTEMHPIEIALRDTFRQRVDELADVLELGRAQQQARHRDYVALVRKAGLDQNPDLSAMLYNEATDADIAATRSGGDDVEQLEARVRDDAEASRKALRELYGPERAAEILKRTQAFVNQHPKLKALINTRGIGSKPAVVLALADHVRHISKRPL